jgi:hypothetical protein
MPEVGRTPRATISGRCFSKATSSEWRNRQTRQLEGLVPERAWGFKSPLRHDQNPSPSSRLPGRGRAPQALRALTLFSSVILEIVGMVLLGSAESPPDAKQATAPGMPSAAPTT